METANARVLNGIILYAHVVYKSYIDARLWIIGERDIIVIDLWCTESSTFRDSRD